MKSRLLNWLIGNFTVPKPALVQRQSILIFSILIFFLVLAEWFMDLNTTSFNILIPLLLTNVIITIIAYTNFKSWLGTAQLLILLLAFLAHCFLVPESFHVMVFWMSVIPLIALMFGDVKSSRIWLAITLIGMICGIVYGQKTVGTYQINISYVAFAIRGTIFCLTIVSCFYIIHNLLGKAIQKLENKNQEINQLNLELISLNKNLEKIVRTRTSMIKNKNQRLTKYAFMNSHLVRAPLANILGAIEILGETESMEEYEQIMNMIALSATNLDNVIKEVALELRSPEDLTVNGTYN
ncbi:hypothetical protein SAMN05421640_1458 [Ekhidna lutea]|uniref:Signal transduction histidine kinase dimerisation/phosphoacceptor domain-containing protein n=1 Tax=Ekhidna lutea TaxID=447679 RepID=A0A239HSM8_EKHLU|nr:hypothetical protein [Ekhidna lutea]SNS83863.1 hypothetical protein SAMN05421640_1458 [Ekhidna lutea]